MVAREAGRAPFPIPEPLLRRMFGRYGFPALAPGALNHLKYSIMVDATTFRQAAGFLHRRDELAVLRDYKARHPAPGG